MSERQDDRGGSQDFQSDTLGALEVELLPIESPQPPKAKDLSPQAAPVPVAPQAPLAEADPVSDGETALPPATPSSEGPEFPSEVTKDLPAPLAIEALFGDVDVGDALTPLTSWTDAEGEQIAAKIASLDACRERLTEARQKRNEGLVGAGDFDRAMADAQVLLDDAGELIEGLSQREGADQVRRMLVDTYFRLHRVVDQYQSGATQEHRRVPTLERAKVKDKALAARVRKAAASGPRPPLSRGIKFTIVLGILVVLRVALLFGGQEEEFKQVDILRTALPEGAGSVTQNLKPPSDEAARKGLPSIDLIGLTRDSTGLLAIVSSNTHTSKSVNTTFTWLENGQVLTVESLGRLAAQKLKPGATYRVEIKVTNDKGSTTAMSEPFAIAGDAATKK